MAGTRESAKAPAYAAQMALFAILLCVKKLIRAGDERAIEIAQRFNKLEKIAALLPSIPVGMIATLNEIVKEFWGKIAASEYENNESVFSAEVIELIKARFPQTNSWTIERGWRPLTFLFYSLQQLKDLGVEGQTAALAKISVEQLEACGLVRDGDTEAVEPTSEAEIANGEYRFNGKADVSVLSKLFVEIEIPIQLRNACDSRSNAEQVARTAKRLALLTGAETEDLAATIFLQQPAISNIPPAAEILAAAGNGGPPAHSSEKLGTTVPSYQAPVTTPTMHALSTRSPSSRYGDRKVDPREFEEIEPVSLLQQLWHVGSVIAILFLAFFIIDSYYYSGSYLFGHFRAYSDVVLGLAFGLLLGAAAVVFYVTSQKLYWRRGHG